MNRNTAILLFLGALLTPAGYGATFLFTDYFRQFGGSETDTGRLLGIAVLGTLLGVPAVGWTAHRIGGPMLASIGAATLCCGDLLLISTQHQSILQQAAGLLIGLGWGIYYVSGPLCLTERTTPENRKFWFNRFGAFQITGTGLSPAIASFLNSFVKLPVTVTIVAMALCSGLAAYTYFNFGRLSPKLRLDAASSQPGNWLPAIREILHTPAIYPIYMVFFGASIFSLMMTFQGSLVEAYGLNKGTYFFTYAAVVSFSRFTLASAMQRWNSNRLSISLVLSMIVGVLAMFLVNHGVAFQIISAGALGIGSGLLFTTLQTQVVDGSAPHNQSSALTWFVLAHFSGLFGMPLLGGWLIANRGNSAFLTLVLLLASMDLLLAIRRNFLPLPGRLEGNGQFP